MHLALLLPVTRDGKVRSHVGTVPCGHAKGPHPSSGLGALPALGNWPRWSARLGYPGACGGWVPVQSWEPWEAAPAGLGVLRARASGRA